MYDLSGFQRDLLYVIHGMGRPSGQELKEELEEYYHEEINHGRLYPNLDTLVDKQLVRKGQIDRRTNYYQITEEGIDELYERRKWEYRYFPLTESRQGRGTD
ncbi:PadR family transcriptional regulator [Haloarchaeobius sp. DFWS5]|uniref:PadR family transcriptional regulator n=1 Tax=Haloarchaeobius sp. DFWS5 TaxID=3446114 RepID=UPI003EB6C90D